MPSVAYEPGDLQSDLNSDTADGGLALLAENSGWKCAPSDSGRTKPSPNPEARSHASSGSSPDCSTVDRLGRGRTKKYLALRAALASAGMPVAATLADRDRIGGSKAVVPTEPSVCTSAFDGSSVAPYAPKRLRTASDVGIR